MLAIQQRTAGSNSAQFKTSGGQHLDDLKFMNWFCFESELFYFIPIVIRGGLLFIKDIKEESGKRVLCGCGC